METAFERAKTYLNIYLNLTDDSKTRDKFNYYKQQIEYQDTKYEEKATIIKAKFNEKIRAFQETQAQQYQAFVKAQNEKESLKLFYLKEDQEHKKKYYEKEVCKLAGKHTVNPTELFNESSEANSSVN